MAAKELSRNYETRYCLFYIDSYDNDIKNLPTSKESGKAELSLSTPCCYGSIAKDAKGQQYLLTGNDEWVLSKSSSGSGSEYPVFDIATDEEINDMLNDVFLM